MRRMDGLVDGCSGMANGDGCAAVRRGCQRAKLPAGDVTGCMTGRGEAYPIQCLWRPRGRTGTAGGADGADDAGR